jgi:sugar O-acyltransferase (sialic acid O-acetyltransferase NeuD family)
MAALFIYCAGGFGKEVMDVARRFNVAHRRWSDVHFLDDVCETAKRYDAEVFNFAAACTWLKQNPGEVIIASGEPATRLMLRQRLEGQGIPLGSLIDTTTIVADTARIEDGVVITPLCSISSDALIRTNASVNTMSIIGHDVVIGENTVISSMVNIGGKTKIGKNSYLGMGALIRDEVAIGDNVIIGMGSVVYNDIPDNMIALGNPARPMRPNTDKKVFK